MHSSHSPATSFESTPDPLIQSRSDLTRILCGDIKLKQLKIVLTTKNLQLCPVEEARDRPSLAQIGELETPVKPMKRARPYSRGTDRFCPQSHTKGASYAVSLGFTQEHSQNAAQR